MKIINEANEKFKDMQEEICNMLFTLLRKINVVEKEIYERSIELKQKKEAMGIPKSQIGPGEKELFGELKKRLGEIIKPCCTDKLLKRGYGGSFGNPQKYSYIDGECTVKFIMKTSKRAVVETYYHAGIDQKHKFVIKYVDDKWLIDEVYYGFTSEPDKWYVDSLI